MTHSRNPKVKSDPISVTMFVGNPWDWTMCLTKLSVSVSRSIVPSHTKKCLILVNRLIITHSASLPLLAGSPVMKSMKMQSYGLCGGSISFSNPKGACLIGLICQQVSQLSMY